MKWFRFTSAVMATLGLTTAAHAGLLDLFKKSGASKSCGCAPCYQPQCCKPTIVKPCCPNIFTYQRKLSCLKPPCCDTCGAPQACCQPAGPGCAPACPPTCAAPAACAPAAAPACAAPAACAPAAAPTCAAPAACAPAPACAAPAQCAPAGAPTCAAPAGCAPAPACAAPAACAPAAAPGQCAPAAGCCPQAGCCPKAGCCNADPCAIAKLIYKSQTACYAKDRRKAIHELGDNYDCACNPEIMTAFIYALNDADERVRAKAADEIGDQVRRNRCCCSREVIAALTAALGDCDRSVRRQAAEGLEACGYEVVKGCCQGVSCDPCACNYGGPRPCVPPCVQNGAPPAPAKEKTAPPAPGTEKVYFPAKLRYSRPSKSRARLANLFGLLN